MKVIAILYRSAGNDTVGEMWKETGIFNLDTPINDILQWASDKTVYGKIEDFRSCLEITIGQEDTQK